MKTSSMGNLRETLKKMASSSSNTKLIVSTNKKTGTEIDEECGRASKAPQPPVSPIPEDQVKSSNDFTTGDTGGGSKLAKLRWQSAVKDIAQ